MDEIQANINVCKRLWDTKEKWEELQFGEVWSSKETVRNTILSFLGDLIPDNPQWKILEIAPGAGRATYTFLPLAREIVLVDLNEAAIQICQEKCADLSFIGCGTQEKFPQIRGYVNDGISLSMIQDKDFDLIFSFDSFVHLDKRIIKEYLRQIADMILPSGFIFLHHSRNGVYNPGWRSNMTLQLIHEYCEEFNLSVFRENVRIRESDAFVILKQTAAIIRKSS